MGTTPTVLILGSGGREHALAHRMAREGAIAVVSPGNAGIAQSYRCIAPPSADVAGFVAVARALKPTLVIVGPEQPLVDGVVDALTEIGIPTLGPQRSAAALEGSKAHMKEVCHTAGLRTAAFGVFTTTAEVERFLADRDGRWVVKADGLCAGKGVVVCDDVAHTIAAAGEMLGQSPGAGRFGAASTRIVVEEFLPGVEMSILALVDGERAALFAPARDHKTLHEGHTGPNTGGMGVIAPLDVTAAFLANVRAEVFAPVLRELARRGTPYRGILYAGLMVDDDRVAVLEFNVRLGDPEAQALLLGTETPLLPLFLAVARGENLPDGATLTACRPVTVVVAAAHGYPDAPRAGDAIDVPTMLPQDSALYFAGVTQRDDQLLTAGGRVLACAAVGTTHAESQARAYALVDQVMFSGRQVRRDIGDSVVRGRTANPSAL